MADSRADKEPALVFYYLSPVIVEDPENVSEEGGGGCRRHDGRAAVHPGDGGSLSLQDQGSGDHGGGAEDRPGHGQRRIITSDHSNNM